MIIHIGIVDNIKGSFHASEKLLSKDSKFEIAFSTSNVNDCFKFLEDDKVIDVLIWTFSLSAREDMDVIRYIKEHFFHIKIVYITPDSNYLSFSGIMDIGIDGLLLEDTEYSYLRIALQQVQEGITYIDYRLHRLYQRYQNKTYIIECKLTPREKEVISCVAAGMINKEIAYCLRIREETVKNHLSNIFRKFHVNDRTEAVIYAIKHHHIEL